jgi:ATP-dependent protease ClpP protease subunit
VPARLQPADTRSRTTEPSGGASGQASDIAIHAKEILRVRRVLTEIYQRHCGKDGESAADGLQRFGSSARSVGMGCA